MNSHCIVAVRGNISRNANREVNSKSELQDEDSKFQVIGKLRVDANVCHTCDDESSTCKNTHTSSNNIESDGIGGISSFGVVLATRSTTIVVKHVGIAIVL